MGCSSSKPSASKENSLKEENSLSDKEKQTKRDEAAAKGTEEEKKDTESAKAADLSEEEKRAIESEFEASRSEKSVKTQTSVKSEDAKTGNQLDDEHARTEKWNEAAVAMAENAKHAKELSVDDRVKLIEKNYATMWKANHEIDANSLKSVVDESSYGEEVRDSWNWRRRFGKVSADASDVHIKYLSEKENLESVDLCKLPRASGNVKIFDLPRLDFKPLEGQDLEDRWSHAQEHELCVGFSALKKALDVHYGFPKHVFPILIEWTDSSNTSTSMVLALVSKASKQAWLQCLSKSLPDALQSEPSCKPNQL